MYRAFKTASLLCCAWYQSTTAQVKASSCDYSWSIIYKRDILHSPIHKLMQLLQITPAIHIECMFPINATQYAQDPPNFSICVIIPKVTPANWWRIFAKVYSHVSSGGATLVKRTCTKVIIQFANHAHPRKTTRKRSSPPPVAKKYVHDEWMRRDQLSTSKGTHHPWTLYLPKVIFAGILRGSKFPIVWWRVPHTSMGLIGGGWKACKRRRHSFKCSLHLSNNAHLYIYLTSHECLIFWPRIRVFVQIQPSNKQPPF